MGGTLGAVAAIRTPNNSATSSFSNVMVKVHRIRLSVSMYCFGFAISVYVYLIIFYVTGTMPYFWVFLLLAVVSLSLFLLQAAHFSSPSRARRVSFKPFLGRPTPPTSEVPAGNIEV
jgi:hypothetical protein